MNAISKRGPVLLMCVSMIMLLLFVGLWLKKEYQGAEDRLQSDLDRIFIESVRVIEDSLVHALFFKATDANIVSGLRTDSITAFKRKTIKQSIGNIEKSFIKKDPNIDIQKDSSYQITIRSKVDEADDEDFKGTLSMVVSLQDSMELNAPHTGDVMAFWRTGDTISEETVLPVLKASFSKLYAQSELTLDHEVILLPDNITNVDMQSRVYKDVLTQKSYAAMVSGTSMYLWKQIGPQILFGLFLILCTGLAFYTVHRNLAKQEKLTAIKNDFISNMTHELKTPLTTVGVALEALSQFDAMKDREKRQEYINISKKELSRLNLLVDKVLNMSTMESAPFDLRVEKFDMKEMVEDVLQSMELYFQKKSAIAHFNTEGEQFEIEADKVHLSNVMYTLLDNSVKYGGDHPEIDILLHNTQSRYTVYIEDKGIGIPPEYKDKVFDKFFRVPHGDEHSVKGHGLGLFYVKKIVDKHGGEIKMIPKSGPGSKMKITLPKYHGED